MSTDRISSRCTTGALIWVPEEELRWHLEQHHGVDFSDGRPLDAVRELHRLTGHHDEDGNALELPE
jgi:hypothetical protein